MASEIGQDLSADGLVINYADLPTFTISTSDIFAWLSADALRTLADAALWILDQINAWQGSEWIMALDSDGDGLDGNAGAWIGVNANGRITTFSEFGT